ncbi:MAG: Ldh family oxidoreductase [Rhodobacteraceae bacterium]|nr:Ldh family oxidoreductase [Paracoccaceae bacterium]
MTTVTLSPAATHDLIMLALTQNKTSKANARSVADALIAAQASGQSGHGISRVPSYAAQSRNGKVDGFATPVVEKVSDTIIRIDAANGFTYPAFNIAIDALPEMAKINGMAIAAVHRSHHFGQGGAHCEALAHKGLVSFVFGNATASIAPWGAKRPLFGTNPISFAAPVPGRDPFVVDLAVSRVAKGKIMAAEKTGSDIPEGWALDADGNPTTNASAAMKGTMVPIGEAKGAALAMMIEVMGAALVGSALGFETSGLISSEGGPANMGQLILVIDPQRTSAGAFDERMTTLIDTVESTEGARVPGTRRLAERQKANIEGLTMPLPIVNEVRVIAGLEPL